MTTGVRSASSGLTPAEEVANLVLEILEVTEPPVDAAWVASKLGMTVFLTEFTDDEIHGQATVRNGVVRIDVNAKDSQNRSRFTIAHEIGHGLLHLQGARSGEFRDDSESASETGPRVFNRVIIPPGSDTTETQANDFAACLLMPRAFMTRAWETERRADVLARRFQVSPAAMQYRIQNLKLQ